MRLLYIIAFLAFVTAPLSACGVKPKTLEAPEEYGGTAYPRTYPNR